MKEETRMFKDFCETSEQDYRELCDYVIDLENQVANLTTQLENLQNGKGRKAEVLEILKTTGAITIVAIAERLGISTKNVSSQLTYLRQDGYNICTDVNGKKFLVEK
jgi:biotin operon repressor